MPLLWWPWNDDCCQEVKQELNQINHQLAAQRILLYDILADVRIIIGQLRPRLVGLTITLSPRVIMSLQVGSTTVATANGFDQFGQPFPIDFTTNPPAWSVSDPALASIAPNAADPNSEDVTGLAAGSETLTVVVAGLTASITFDVVAPVPVLTSVTITTNPAV